MWFNKQRNLHDLRLVVSVNGYVWLVHGIVGQHHLLSFPKGWCILKEIIKEALRLLSYDLKNSLIIAAA